jgi:hypothetical protein
MHAGLKIVPSASPARCAVRTDGTPNHCNRRRLVPVVNSLAEKHSSKLCLPLGSSVGVGEAFDTEFSWAKLATMHWALKKRKNVKYFTFAEAADWLHAGKRTSARQSPMVLRSRSNGVPEGCLKPNDTMARFIKSCYRCQYSRQNNSMRRRHSLRQVFTGSRQHQLPVFDPPNRDQMVGNTPQDRCPPTNNQDFQAIIVIKMDVQA